MAAQKMFRARKERDSSLLASKSAVKKARRRYPWLFLLPGVEGVRESRVISCVLCGNFEKTFIYAADQLKLVRFTCTHAIKASPG